MLFWSVRLQASCREKAFIPRRACWTCRSLHHARYPMPAAKWFFPRVNLRGQICRLLWSWCTVCLAYPDVDVQWPTEGVCASGVVTVMGYRMRKVGCDCWWSSSDAWLGHDGIASLSETVSWEKIADLRGAKAWVASLLAVSQYLPTCTVRVSLACPAFDVRGERRGSCISIRLPCSMIKVDEVIWSTGVDICLGAPLIVPLCHCMSPSCRSTHRSPHTLPMDRLNNSKGEQEATASQRL